jgi:hypothetical protein
MEILKDRGSEHQTQLATAVSDWCLEFEYSSLFDGLNEQQQLLSEDIITFFCEYMTSGATADPAHWHEDLVEEVLVYGFPAHIVADENYFAAVRPVLCKFLAFLQASQQLDEAHSLNLQHRIEAASTLMMRNAFDRSYWGLAKSMVMQAWGAGIDPTDEEALTEYFHQHIDQAGSSGSEA